MRHPVLESEPLSLGFLPAVTKQKPGDPDGSHQPTTLGNLDTDHSFPKEEEPAPLPPLRITLPCYTPWPTRSLCCVGWGQRGSSRDSLTLESLREQGSLALTAPQGLT